MEAKYTSSPLNGLHPTTNNDEIFMQRSLIFADSLKDLRNIRSQLYSAAEFFEDSYHKNDNDQLRGRNERNSSEFSSGLVAFSFAKATPNKALALISTIDHLGSVTSKVDAFLDQNIDEAFETNLRVLCIQQRLQTCQTYSDHEGFSQQSLLIQIPKYHKQYLLPDGRFSEAIQAEKAKAESSGLRRGRNEQNSSEFSSGLVAFSFAKATPNKAL
nr:protein ABIL2 [Tanacetum cinerariifolium]